MLGVSLIIPAKNEEVSISQLLEGIQDALLPYKAELEYEVVIVDDSTDRTAEIARSMGARVVKGRGLGLGQAIIDGIDASKSDVVLVMDSDLSHDPKAIPSLLKPILEQGVDIVIGSRYCFPKGTKIITARQTNNQHGNCLKPMGKNIERIEIGDEVLSYDGHKKEYKKVVNVSRRKVQGFVTLKFSNGNELRCTVEHPIAVDNKGGIEWVSAKGLKIGDGCLQYQYIGLGWRLKGLGFRNKSWEEIYGLEKCEQIKKVCRDIHKRLRSAPDSAYQTEEYINKQRLAQLRVIERDPSINIRKGIGSKKAWANPMSPLNSEEYRRKISRSKVKAHADVNSGYNTSPKLTSQARSLRIRQALADSNSTYNTEQYRENRRRAAKQLWTNPEYARKVLVNSQRGLNKSGFRSTLEKRLSYIARHVTKGFIFYNGDGRRKVSVGRWTPDFITEKEDKIIDVRGCNIHCCPECEIDSTPFGEPCEIIRGKDAEHISNAEGEGKQV